MRRDVIETINEVRSNKGLRPITELRPESCLRSDLEMDSLDLAEFTARIERKTGIDLFSEGLVSTVGEVLKKLS